MCDSPAYVVEPRLMNGNAAMQMLIRGPTRSPRRRTGELLRDSQTQRLRSLEFDDLFKLGRLLEWQVGWAGATQVFVHRHGGTFEIVSN